MGGRGGERGGERGGGALTLKLVILPFGLAGRFHIRFRVVKPGIIATTRPRGSLGTVEQWEGNCDKRELLREQPNPTLLSPPITAKGSIRRVCIL